MDQARIQKVGDVQGAILDDIVALLSNLSETLSYYPPQESQAVEDHILRPDGLLVSTHAEEPLLLINEFRSVALVSYLELFKALRSNLGSPLFGFAERTLMEMTATWLFIEVSPYFTHVERQRLATLVLLHHERTYEKNKDQRVILDAKGEILTKLDKTHLGDDLSGYIGDVVIPRLTKNKKAEQFSVIDQFGPEVKTSYIAALHSRLHGNPLAVNAAVDATRPRAHHTMHQTELIYSGLQILEYHYSNPEVVKKDEWQQPLSHFRESFEEIREVFSWLNRSHV